MADRTFDAVVVGAGPNGLAAAITLALAGRSVKVFEASETVGGGARSEELTLPGYVHDVCSAIHPLGAWSPFFRSLPLERHGLRWVHAPVELAHPLDPAAPDRTAVLLRSVDATADGLGVDGANYRRTLGWIADHWHQLEGSLLGPLARVPRHPLALARFGVQALLPATTFARRMFEEESTRALFGGMAGHSFLPLEHAFTASFGLVLGALGHVVGWPMPVGGSQNITDAMASFLRSLGGEIETGHTVQSIAELPPATVALLDVTPVQAAALAPDRIAARRRGQLARFRYGPGVFKADYALSEPVPWASDHCRRAGTVHLVGSLDELAAAERAVASGHIPDRPFVLVAQPSLFDGTRAPVGGHTLWVYCHVPARSTVDMTDAVEDQIERFAPGFRDVVLSRSTMDTKALEAHNPNYVGGDIAGGSHGGMQILLRPYPALDPYRLGPGLFLCSASTPPGGGVHGMSGFHAARSALRSELA